jgi:hypothetical protein
MPDVELRAGKSPDSWSGLKVERRAGERVREITDLLRF